jgi:hypothetical protein
MLVPALALNLSSEDVYVATQVLELLAVIMVDGRHGHRAILDAMDYFKLASACQGHILKGPLQPQLHRTRIYMCVCAAMCCCCRSLCFSYYIISYHILCRCAGSGRGSRV